MYYPADLPEPGGQPRDYVIHTGRGRHRQFLGSLGHGSEPCVMGVSSQFGRQPRALAGSIEFETQSTVEWEGESPADGAAIPRMGEG